MSELIVRVIGPREQALSRRGEVVVSTVSKAPEDWMRELSPFHLGPVPIYGGRTSLCMENAWQFAKVYAQHADAQGLPLPSYWAWAQNGWRQPAIRYPIAKGAKPLYCLWDGNQLGYIEARKSVYWELYRNAVRETEGFRRLQEMASRHSISLFDFDGYDHDARGMTLADVIENPNRPMGHAFVLKAMLLHGTNVTAKHVIEIVASSSAELSTAGTSQLALF